MTSVWTWGQKRQFTFLITVFTIIFIIVAVFLTLNFIVKPPEVIEIRGNDPVVIWSNTFPVGGNLHGAIAHFANTENEMFSARAFYKFSFFDERGRIISEKKGDTSFGAGESFFVFERNLNFENTPAWTSFSWERIDWKEGRKDRDEVDYNVSVPEVNLRSDIPTPRLETRVENIGFLTLPSVEVVALIMDEHENVVTASRGVTVSIPFRESTPLTLSWPGPFTFSKNVCNPPLTIHMALLSGHETNELEVINVLRDFEKEMEEGFSWTLSMNELGENESGITANSLRSEARFLSSRENPRIVIVFPEERSRIVSLQILRELEEYDFIETMPVKTDNDGGLNIDIMDVERVLKSICVQKPRDIRIYTRISD